MQAHGLPKFCCHGIALVDNSIHLGHTSNQHQLHESTVHMMFATHLAQCNPTLRNFQLEQ